MQSLATELVKYEISVNALSSLSFMLLEAGSKGEEVRSLKIDLARRIIFRNLSPFEKEVWRVALMKSQNDVCESFYYTDEGAIDFCIGERARLKGLTIDDNPYPEEAFGFWRWLDGWSEQDKRTRDDEAYRDCNEYTEWLADIAKEMAE